MPIVLITGAGGMIGKKLVAALQTNGYSIRSLVRNHAMANGKDRFYYNYQENEIDPSALRDLDYIINLAGANVSKRWTQAYKKEVYESRINTTKFLFESVKKYNIPLKKFISASAIGYYGDSEKHNLIETDATGSDFLARVCHDWEQAASQFDTLNIPLCIFRIGVVITPEGGFVKSVSAPIKFNLGAHLGTGKQFISWIALDDLVSLFLVAVEKPALVGTYNAVASNPHTLEQIDNTMATFYRKKIWLPNIPAWALKLALGEMSTIVLASTHASNAKIKETGFVFRHEDFAKGLEGE